jgi:hypothetical protein
MKQPIEKENNKNNLLNIYNKIIKIYPTKLNVSELTSVSHLEIISQDFNLRLENEIDTISGLINYKNKNILINKITTKNKKTYNLNEYLKLYIKYLNKDQNPIINQTKFNYVINTYNNLEELCIIKLNEDIIPNYITNSKTPDPYIDLKLKIEKAANHFYFDSFSVNSNQKNLSKELNRLIINKEKYDNLHFHLENNHGGDLVPVHIIIRILAGDKEDWMKPIKKCYKVKKYSHGIVGMKKIKQVQTMKCLKI